MAELELTFPFRQKLYQLALNTFPNIRQQESWGGTLPNSEKRDQNQLCIAGRHSLS